MAEPPVASSVMKATACKTIFIIFGKTHTCDLTFLISTLQTKQSLSFRHDLREKSGELATEFPRSYRNNTARGNLLRSTLITANCLDTSVSVFNECVTAFSFHRGLFLFFSFCVSRVVINPPHSLAVNPSHIDFSWISKDFILGGQAEKVNRNCGESHSGSCIHTCTSPGANREMQSSVHVPQL